MSRHNKAASKKSQSPQPTIQAVATETTVVEKPKKEAPEINQASSPHRLTVILSIVAILISIVSAGNSIYQTMETRKIYRANVRPDVQCVIRHSSRPEDKDNPLATELVIWNNGPINAVSVSMAYREYLIDPVTLKVLASIGIAEDLLDSAILQPELTVGQKIGKPVVGTSLPAVFVVNITYYRESDMEKFSREDFILYESGSYYDQQSFMSRPDYETIMKNLRRKMRAEALRPVSVNRQMAPALPGTVNVNWDFANLTEDGSWTNGIGTNSVTITPIRPAP